MRTKILFPAFLFVLFLFVGYFLDLHFQNQKQHSLFKNFQNEIFKKEKELEKNLVELKKLDQQKCFDFFSKENIFEKKGFVFLVYKNDSLISWSDNSISVSEKFDSSIFNKQIYLFKNAWCRIRKISDKNTEIIGLTLIKREYHYKNEYLKNDFQKNFSNDIQAEITVQKNKYAIYSNHGQFLFSLQFDKSSDISSFQENLLNLIYLISFLFLVISLYYLNHSIKFLIIKKWSLYLFFIELFFIVFLSLHYHFPEIFFKLKIFNSFYFASSELLLSLGHVLVYSIVFSAFSILFFKKNQSENFPKEFSRNAGMIYGLSLFLIIYFLFGVLIFLFETLIINSQISLDFNNIFSLTGFSYLILFIFSINIFSFVFVAFSICKKCFNQFSTKEYLIYALISFIIVCIGSYFLKFDTIYFLLPLLLIAVHFLFFKKNISFFSFANIFFYLVLFSIFMTIFLNNKNNIKEKQYRNILAEKLSVDRDPMAEFLFNEIEKEIKIDKFLLNFLNKKWIDDNKIIHYLQKKYFDDYWLKYNIQITICEATDSLYVKPDNIKMPCAHYFSSRILHNAIETDYKNLYFIDDPSGRKWYLASIDLNNKDSLLTIYFDIVPKYVPTDLAYPQLLVDQKAKVFSLPQNYSYAKYINGKLINQVGKFYYNHQLSSYNLSSNKIQFFNSDGFNHMYYKDDETTDLLISKPQITCLGYIAPFSFLIIFLSIFFCFYFIILKYPFRFNKTDISFKNRLQISFISIIIVSFLLIGVTSVIYIIKLNENKNDETINEKAHSVLIEVEHSLSNVDVITPEMFDYVNGLLFKLSNVFFTDINLYDLNGNLIATSRPKIFEEGLISSKMDPSAYFQLMFKKNTTFTHQEKIGELQFVSTYIPFRNDKNKTVAFINLPYFAKQNELRDEISSFISTFINIYFLLISIAVAITLLVSTYVTRPLELIKEKISKLSFGKKNSKIEWTQHDEIGNLIKEYNRMVDELSFRAELLAKSEREGAWREMAKQIAHEIKNPLTPLRLNIQNIYKAWKDKSPDLDIRFERFNKTTIEQIDALSAIASEFSDFAKISSEKKQNVCLNKIIQSAIDLYKDSSSIHISFFVYEDYYVLADKDHLLRVFNNLIKNSVQALDSRTDGKIDIQINSEQSTFIIQIKDNGSGIPEDQKDKIFSFNFTTKTSGMGLGLAMVKSIVENHDGKIWFNSDSTNGTIFYISLPKYS